MKKSVKFLGLSITLIFFSSVCLLAQDDVAAAPSSSLFDLYLKGGAIGFLLTGLSMVSMTLCILNFLQLKREKLIPPYIVNDLEGLIEDDDIDGAIDLCESEDVPVAKIMGASLNRIDSGPDKMVDAMVEAGEEQSNMLNTKVSYINLIGGLAPMIGLFGTVSGMISAFDTIATSNGAATPADLARGIMEALVTTFLGLFVAIPTVAAYHFLKNQVNIIVIETNNICSDLLDRVNQN